MASSAMVELVARPMYYPLNADRQEIRLLTLSHGDFEDDIQLRLRPHLLNQESNFAALSYCWGNRHQLAEIRVNEEPLLVTQNLEIALRHWRNAHEDLVIWVDAICINQLDRLERENQVRMMGRIYASASYVRVWLGEESSDSNIAMDFINRIETVNFEDPGTVLDQDAMTAVKKLLRRPWWSRLWVVQEALFAEKLHFHCGNRKAGVEEFIKFQEKSARFRFDTSPHLQALRGIVSGPMNLLFWSWDDYKSQIQKGGISLSQMITVTCQSQYSEPLDRIFALLGLCSELERRVIPIDYTMSIQTLNILVSKFFLISRRAQKPLYYLQFHQSGKDSSLPSWVSDFTTPDDENHLTAPTFTAGADNYAWVALGLPMPSHGIGSYNSLDVEFEQEGSLEILVVPGLIFDEVIAVFESPWIEFVDGFDVDEILESKLRRRNAIAHAASTWWTYVQTLPSEADPYTDNCGRFEAFWRTLITNHGMYISRGPVTAEMGFPEKCNEWMGRNSTGSNDEAYFRPYSDPAVDRCMWRSFLVTKRGYFSIGPRKTCVSDLVCIFRGAHAPFVLRPRDDGCYGLVGEAYVHGVMDGSFVRGANKEDTKKFRIR